MDFIWDKQKNERLKHERGISFEEIADLIIAEEFIDIIDNSSRPNQFCFILNIQDYTWVVPFIIDPEERIVLKTAFKSRKFHKEYGGKNGRP